MLLVLLSVLVSLVSRFGIWYRLVALPLSYHGIPLGRTPPLASLCEGGVMAKGHDGGIVCIGFLPRHSEPVTDVTGSGIRSPFHASGGLFSFSSERKEEKKRRQKLRFWISLRAFARRLSRLFYHANAVPCKLPLNVALSLLLFSLPLLL